jgi:hypothetical protein
VSEITEMEVFEELQNRIKELKQQIEKMKCCNNCCFIDKETSVSFQYCSLTCEITGLELVCDRWRCKE